MTEQGGTQDRGGSGAGLLIFLGVLFAVLAFFGAFENTGSATDAPAWSRFWVRAFVLVVLVAYFAVAGRGNAGRLQRAEAQRPPGWERAMNPFDGAHRRACLLAAVCFTILAIACFAPRYEEGVVIDDGISAWVWLAIPTALLAWLLTWLAFAETVGREGREQRRYWRFLNARAEDTARAAADVAGHGPRWQGEEEIREVSKGVGNVAGLVGGPLAQHAAKAVVRTAARAATNPARLRWEASEEHARARRRAVAIADLELAAAAAPPPAGRRKRRARAEEFRINRLLAQLRLEQDAYERNPPPPEAPPAPAPDGQDPPTPA